jgi:hypothetical protein
MLALTLWLCLSSSALAIPVTYSVTASSYDLATYNGFLTVDLDLATGPVRNLSGTVGYTVTNFSLVATSSWPYLPSYTFSSATLGNSAEYCLGKCVFGAGDLTVIRFLSGDGLALQLAFNPTLIAAGSWYAQGMLGPMLTVSSAKLLEWGPIQASTVSVSGPNTLILMALGMGLFMSLRKKIAR